MDTIKHNSARLYNCDEPDIPTVQHKHTEILGLKGKRQTSSLQSAEQGSLATVVNCMSPTGHFIPPLLVFPRKNMKQELINGTPSGAIHAYRRGGYGARFFPCGFFIHQIYKTDKRRSCYLSTGRAVFLEVITLARENHVDINCLPPHSSHKMQPLDKAFMGPLKTFYCQEIEKWFRSHPRRVVTVYQICELFGNVYKRAATGEIAANGFRVHRPRSL